MCRSRAFCHHVGVIPDAIIALVDPNRLAVAGALANRMLTSAEVVERTGLDARAVIEAIGQLRQVGLVEAHGDGYRLDTECLRKLASDLADVEIAMDPYIGFGMTDDEIAVLERFFSARTLTEMPASRAKRLIVLERISHEFDLGARYSESDVNDVLRPFHLDVATIRRHLIDEGFLDRDSGEYLRSGGRV